jgi:hypothetical protein
MANDVYQLVIVGQSAGQFYENVLHFKNGSTNDPDPVAGASSLIEGFVNTLQDSLVDCMCVDTSITGYKAKRVNNGGGPTVAEPQVSVPGTVSGTSATSATASLLLVPFVRSSKFYSGKVFIPGLSESMLAGNVISGTLITLLDSFANNLASSFTQTPHTWDYVVWSRTVSLPFTPFDITVSAKVGIQRRRLKPVM